MSTSFDAAFAAAQGHTALETALARAIQGGGSGFGMSYYSSAARCGRRAILSQRRRDEVTDADTASLPWDKHALVIGSIYHKLHEQARKPDGPQLDFQAPHTNVNITEAMRMFNGFVRLWGLDFWGKCLAVERKLPGEDAEAAARVFKLFGAQVTGTVDMVVEVRESDLERVWQRVPGLMPGRYIVDWKTADQTYGDDANYKFGLQTMWYPFLWNLCFPAEKVDGIIFDVAMKRGRRRDRSMLADDFAAFAYPLCERDVVEELKAMVQQGQENVIRDRPNRAECVDWRGQACPYFGGACKMGPRRVDLEAMEFEVSG